MDAFEQLADDYAAWWIDFLGEHSHVGGAEATRWLAARCEVGPDDLALDAGAFVGAAARLLAMEMGARVVATDINPDFLRVGRSMPGGDGVAWVTADTGRLPFDDGVFASAWCLDSFVAAKELTRVCRAGATLCLCTEAPADGRGGLDAFIEEWGELGWDLAAHRPMTLEAAQQWRQAEAAMVAGRRHYEERYGTRGYLAQLDLLGSMVLAYERGEQGHHLFVLRRA